MQPTYRRPSSSGYRPSGQRAYPAHARRGVVYFHTLYPASWGGQVAQYEALFVVGGYITDISVDAAPGAGNADYAGFAYLNRLVDLVVVRERRIH